MIKVENLQKSFKTKQSSLEILKGLNFEIAKGQIVAITGNSGSGKSTLLGLLSALDKPDSGKIIYDEKDIFSMSFKEQNLFRAQNISLIFQNYYLIPHLTALENVMLPLQILKLESPLDSAKSLLNEVGLSHRLDHYPGELSGGECQRVAIARGLITKPLVLLADEPTGSLDSETGEKVMKLYFNLVRKHNLTSVIVTHNEDLASNCDRELKLHQGVVSS
jgi:putative ABC transport system ATP-binding protein